MGPEDPAHKTEGHVIPGEVLPRHKILSRSVHAVSLAS